MKLDFTSIMPYFSFFWNGLALTVKVTIASLIFGFLVAIILVALRLTKIKPLKWLVAVYTSFFRGTPMLLQLFLIYFAVPQLSGRRIILDAVISGIIAFSLNAAAYLAESLRGGIEAIDPGQKEAAKALGIGTLNLYFYIIFPQALRHVLPALINECINLTKSSSLIATIGAMDLTKAYQTIQASTYRSFEPLMVAAVFYYVIVMVLTLLGKVIERRLGRSDID